MGAPVVHCVTNDVTVGRVADAIAAAGGHPIMASSEAEVAEIAPRADAVVLNCGTPSPERMRALCAAGAAAVAAGVPTVLDPVGCGASTWRTAQVRALATAVRATVIRGGAAEVAALADLPTDATLYGVHSTGGQEDAVARAAAERLSTVAVVGRAIAEGARLSVRQGGDPVLARIVGAGDVLDALIALECASERDGFIAAERALARFDRAAARASGRGPGSFWPAFIDALGADA